MKVGIVSDSHDNRTLLKLAAEDAVAHGAEAFFHCGDVVSPNTLWVFQPLGKPVHVIHGNNQGDLNNMYALVNKPDSVVNYHGQDAAFEISGKRVFLVHYPHYAEALALTGDYDLVCCGHDHKASVKEVSNIKGGSTTLANPGTAAGIGAQPTYILADLDDMSFEIMDVPVPEGYQASILKKP